MAKTANNYTRVDPEIKNQAEQILEQLGIPMSNAIGNDICHSPVFRSIFVLGLRIKHTDNIAVFEIFKVTSKIIISLSIYDLFDQIVGLPRLD